MTPRELQALILTTSACAPYVHTNDMEKIGADAARAKDQAVADALMASGVLTGIQTRRIGVNDLLGDLGLQTGTAIYQKLEQVAASDKGVELALMLLKVGSLDIGHHETQQAIAALPEPPFAPDEKSAMKNMALRTVPVSAAEISTALRGPWGDE